ncbi:hypothetical protein HA466_0271070 [Hirschfeldia incana]|nr:hypothetical protein HA466_0271070 [Hirschfeldia incana]
MKSHESLNWHSNLRNVFISHNSDLYTVAHSYPSSHLKHSIDLFVSHRYMYKNCIPPLQIICCQLRISPSMEINDHHFDEKVLDFIKRYKCVFCLDTPEQPARICKL